MENKIDQLIEKWQQEIAVLKKPQEKYNENILLEKKSRIIAISNCIRDLKNLDLI